MDDISRSGTDSAQTGPAGRAPLSAAPPPSGPEFTRVEVERMEEDGGGQQPGGGPFVFVQAAPSPLAKPPVIAAWIFLALAWMFLGSSAPFTVVIGLPLDMVALLLALMCLGRGAFVTGIMVLLLGTVGSVIVYLMGLMGLLFLGGAAGGHGLV